MLLNVNDFEYLKHAKNLIKYIAARHVITLNTSLWTLHKIPIERLRGKWRDGLGDWPLPVKQHL